MVDLANSSHTKFTTQGNEGCCRHFLHRFLSLNVCYFILDVLVFNVSLNIQLFWVIIFLQHFISIECGINNSECGINNSECGINNSSVTEIMFCLSVAACLDPRYPRHSVIVSLKVQAPSTMGNR